MQHVCNPAWAEGSERHEMCLDFHIFIIVQRGVEESRNKIFQYADTFRYELLCRINIGGISHLKQKAQSLREVLATGKQQEEKGCKGLHHSCCYATQTG